VERREGERGRGERERGRGEGRERGEREGGMSVKLIEERKLMQPGAFVAMAIKVYHCEAD